MADGFVGNATPLDSTGLKTATDALGVGAPEFWSVVSVETSGCGYLPDRRPKILFERHIFSKRTGGRYDGDYSDISNAQPGGYSPTGAGEYERLGRAMALDSHAALQSASWGIGQVMGYNAELVGFGSVELMVSAMSASEAQQLTAMAGFIKANRLDAALRAKQWDKFAAGYNGSNYQINSYDTRLASQYQALSNGGMPDLDIRSGQIYLTYLGYEPHGIDGVMGKMTRSAMNDFQGKNGLALTDRFDAATLAALRAALGL
jgi:hypothetical protein